jgi:hypothetical protein
MNPLAWSDRQLIGVRAILTFVLAFLLAPQVRADALVRTCTTVSAGGCTAPITWELPVNAVNVQVQRTGAPFVKLSEVQPTERIAACYDTTLAPGSGAKCTVNVPSRGDLWQLKSVLYPQVTGSIELRIDASAPRWDSQAPVSTNMLTDLSVLLYGAEQGQPKTLLDSAPWANLVRFKRESGSASVFCFAASLALDTDGDTKPNEESAQTAEWCGTHASPPPVLHLMPPNGITGIAPAP